MRLVLIQWDDPAYSGAHWEDREPHVEIPVDCITCGILLSEDRDNVHIVLNLNREFYAQGIVFPKTHIKRMWKLKVGADIK